MTSLITAGRPATDEYAPYYGRYIDEVPEGDILAILENQIERTTKLLQGLDEKQALFRPTPADWSVKDVICHLSDAERIFGYRALRIARGDTTPLSGFDQVPYAAQAQADERTLSDLLAEFNVVRQSTIWLLRSLPAGAWERRGIASDMPFSVRALAFITAGHENHHVRSLKDDYLGHAVS